MPPPTERSEIKVRAERAVLAAVRLPGSEYDPADPFGELRDLAEQAGATVVGELEQHRQSPEAGTYIGKGKLDELKGLCERLEAQTVIFDHDLSPKQIANIEQHIERKVVDRSELILDIFAGRASTHEARLQVELAQLEYTYPRLRAMWSHLERIVGTGGIGGVGTRGPGEQQLEIDRRLVQRRKTMLQRELAQIQARRSREVAERKSRHFTVGIVGYTNAGKSTLFNTLTAGGAYADDRLFATLTTRTRKWDMGDGVEAMLSDTVGFVRDLPHHLVASFRATLEEATHADLLLVVVDVADPDAEGRLHTVEKTLDEIIDRFAGGGSEEQEGRGWEKTTTTQPPKRLILLNKADKLPDNRELLYWKSKLQDSITICSLSPEKGGTGQGLDELTERVRSIIAGEVREVRMTLPLAASRLVHEVESKAEILGRDYADATVTYHARMGANLIGDIIASGGGEVRVENA
ncbi:MAG: GTPase HflX [Phycisphaerales bacterium]|nr:GTPase HflX [Phycisphaerales bacterium]